MVSKSEIFQERTSCIANINAQLGKNSTQYKIHKPIVSVRLLTTGCNTVIEHLAIFVEKHCAELTKNIPIRINSSALYALKCKCQRRIIKRYSCIIRRS